MTFAQPAARCLRGGLILCLMLASMALAACVSKQEPAPVTAPVQANSKPAVQTPAAPPEEQTPAPAPSVTPAPASTAKATTPKADPVRQLLLSAGRDPDASQPEAGFSLRVPAAIWDGEAFMVNFAADGLQSLDLRWRGKTLHVQADASGSCQALLAVALDETAKALPLALTANWQDGRAEQYNADMPIKRRSYKVQRLTVDSKFVSPPADMMEKIKQDRAEMRAALRQVSPERSWTLPFKRPVPGVVTSLYGSRRVFNNKPKNPHKGVDFDAKEGDPIASLDDGVVVLVASHYYGGNTVVVDHGLGVMSVYLHMSGFNVSKGQRISRGDILGFIGSTGRVTGPHLHLSLYVLGESINAAPCINM